MRRRPAIRRFRSDSRGTSAVEFAIVALPLFLLAFGTLEFGRFLWIRNALQETAANAARCLGILQAPCASGGTADTARTTSFVVNSARSWYVPLVSGNVTVLNGASTCPGFTTAARVEINYQFQTAVPVLLGSLRSGVPVREQACFPIQA